MSSPDRSFEHAGVVLKRLRVDWLLQHFIRCEGDVHFSPIRYLAQSTKSVKVFFFFIILPSSRHCSPISAQGPLGLQTSPVLRSIVLITESIFPLNTCLARLRVKPVTAWKGRCDGNDSA